MSIKTIDVPFGAGTLKLETGEVAKQANGAVMATYGGTTVLVTACMSKKPRADIDFFPLMVEYQEKMYSAGKIPGGFFKREGRPSQKEILTSRIIDRPIRPLFPSGFYNEVQVVATVLSSDGENDPDVIAMVGASAALTISDIPFEGPVGAVRVASVNGEFIVNPTYEQRDNAELELFVVGLKDGIVMIEGEGKEVDDDKVVAALEFAAKELQSIREAQITFQKDAGLPKTDVKLFQAHPDLAKKVKELIGDRLKDAYKIADKQERESSRNAIFDSLVADMSVYDEYKVEGRDVTAGEIYNIFDTAEYELVRDMIFNQNLRADGRKCDEIRQLTSRVGILPRTHGSAIFTRGQTQSLAVVTLGTKRDEQLIESLEDVTFENFMLHYNFPSFSVGETKPMRGPGRREIGHGALAGKALRAVLPTKENFPYTIRVVSEILESNGSSSMASVCAGCLSLMDAGVPIKDMVAGISIGLVTDGDDYRLLTDIMGMEDHHGDMDYKIAGSDKGITAIQLDLKIKGTPVKVLSEGIRQAREARLKILENMKATIAQPKDDVSKYAPRIISTRIPVEKIGEVIGPGGKIIKKIIEETGVESIDIEDDGQVMIASMSKDSADAAIRYVNGLVEVPVVGKVYDGRVEKVTNFGAFVEFLPGKQGLVHVSELEKGFVKDVASVVKVGDKFKVKVIEIDQMKRINLSKKQAEVEAEEVAPSKES